MEINKSEFGRLLGISPARVTQLIQAGRVHVNHRGRIETTSVANAGLLHDRGINPMTLSPVVNGATGETEPGEISTDDTDTERGLRLAKLRAQTKSIELQTAIRRGEFVHHDDVRELLNKIWTIDVTQLYALPDRLAAEIVGIVRDHSEAATAEHAVSALLDREARKVTASTKQALIDWLEAQGVTDD